MKSKILVKYGLILLLAERALPYHTEPKRPAPPSKEGT